MSYATCGRKCKWINLFLHFVDDDGSSPLNHCFYKHSSNPRHKSPLRCTFMSAEDGTCSPKPFRTAVIHMTVWLHQPFPMICAWIPVDRALQLHNNIGVEHEWSSECDMLENNIWEFECKHIQRSAVASKKFLDSCALRHSFNSNFLVWIFATTF